MTYTLYLITYILMSFISLSLYKTTIYKITGHHVRIYFVMTIKNTSYSHLDRAQSRLLILMQFLRRKTFGNLDVQVNNITCFSVSVLVIIYRRRRQFCLFLDASAQRTPPPPSVFTLPLPLSLTHTNTWITQGMTAPPTSGKAFTCCAQCTRWVTSERSPWHMSSANHKWISG